MTSEDKKQFRETVEKAAKAGVGNVIVFWPGALGDTYEEIIESLNLISEHELALRIVPPKSREEARRGGGAAQTAS